MTYTMVSTRGFFYDGMHREQFLLESTEIISWIRVVQYRGQLKECVLANWIRWFERMHPYHKPVRITIPVTHFPVLYTERHSELVELYWLWVSDKVGFHIPHGGVALAPTRGIIPAQRCGCYYCRLSPQNFSLLRCSPWVGKNKYGLTRPWNVLLRRKANSLLSQVDL